MTTPTTNSVAQLLTELEAVEEQLSRTAGEHRGRALLLAQRMTLRVEITRLTGALPQDLPSLARQHQAHLEANGPTVGDCWRTAIACLLEVPRDDVPHWMEIYKDQPDSVQWWHDTVAFVEAARPGWTLTLVRPPAWPIYSHPLISPPHVVLVGKSPRGDWLHAVIADTITGDLVWDPHPAGGGVLTHAQAAVLTRLT